MSRRQPTQQDQVIILAIVDALSTYRDTAFAEREHQKKINAHKQEQQVLEKEYELLLEIPRYELVKKEPQRLRLIELDKEVKQAKQTLLQLELAQSRHTPRLSDDVFRMAEALSHVRLTSTAARDVRDVLRIREAKQELVSAREATRVAKSGSSQAKRNQTTSKAEVDAKNRTFGNHLFKAQQLVTTLRQPFEATIGQHRSELEDLTRQLKVDDKAYQSVNSTVHDLEAANAVDQEQLQEFQKIEVRLKGEVELLEENNRQLLTLDLPAKDLHQAQLRLSGRKTDLHQAQQRVTELSQRIVNRTKELKSSQKQQTTLEKKLHGFKQRIEQLTDWLAVNDLKIPSYSVEDDPASLNWLINNCGAFQEIQQSNIVEKVLRSASRGMKPLGFDSGQLGALKTELLAAQSAMHEAQEHRSTHQQMTHKYAQQQRAQTGVERQEQQAEQYLADCSNDLKSRLCARKLEQQGLIPSRNIFTANLDQFELAMHQLCHMSELESIPEEMQQRIRDIDTEYHQHMCDYLSELSVISKPYKHGWHGKEDYHQQVTLARQKLVVKLTTLVNPDTPANMVLRKSPKAMTILARLGRLATILGKAAACCILVGIPFVIMNHNKNQREEKAKDRFADASATTSPLARDEIVRPIECKA